MTMHATTEAASCTPAFGPGLLPIDPFRSLYVHFGMLLGVEDFRTLDAYHRGKAWHHAAWQHGQGVIWGLGVGLERGTTAEGESEGPLNGELRVVPGLAIDARGRELSLQKASCVDIRAWYAAHEEDHAMADARSVDEATGEVTFEAHVTIEFAACLDRHVPALSEPCDGGTSTTAYSRVVETAQLCLNPGPAPDWRASAPGQFHRLRLLLGLDAPEEADPEAPGTPTEADQAVLDARAEIAALPAEERPSACLDWLRRFAVLDEIEMAPEQSGDEGAWNILPVLPPARVVLAGVNGIRLRPTEGGWELIAAEVDPFVRPVHLPTATIQELVCGCWCGETTAGTGEEEEPLSPRIDPETVELDEADLSFSVVNGPLIAATLDARSVLVSLLDAVDGWSAAEFDTLAYDADTATIRITLSEAPGDRTLRLIVKGTGPFPVLGETRRPLAGGIGGPPGSGHDGADFVHQIGGVS